MGPLTGAEGDERPVSLGRAARRAGLTVDAFLAATEALNGTAEDLRAPGSRLPARYDPDRLRRWIQAFRLPGTPLPATTPEALVPVTAHWTGDRWVLQEPRHGLEATAPRLVTAKRHLTHELAPLLKTEPADIDLDITWDLDTAAMQLWTESLEFKDLARQLLELAAHKRNTAIAILAEQGMTYPEIGAALGISYQRVQQLHTRRPGPSNPSSEPAG